MKYGDIVKGKCKYCGCFNFSFIRETKEKYMVGSIKEEYILGSCLGCGWVQWVKVC